MTRRPYRINYTTNTVTITKAFEKAAQEYGSDAYNMLLEFKRAGFAIVRPAQIKHKSRPSYENMRHYITRCEDNEILLRDYDLIVDLYKDVKGGYSKIYSWFRKECPYYGMRPEFNHDGKVIRMAEQRELRKVS